MKNTMTRADIESILVDSANFIRQFAPYDTGNLAMNAIKYRWISETEFEIYVDVGDTKEFVETRTMKQGTAPYMPFTNETWISPKWNGKQNPNEGWWNRAVDLLVNYLEIRLESKVRSKL